VLPFRSIFHIDVMLAGCFVRNRLLGEYMNQKIPSVPASLHPHWFESIRAKLHGYPEWAVEVGVYGVVGLLIGFGLKNFGRALILGILGAAVIIWVLSTLHIIAVDIAQLKTYLGLSSVANLDDAIKVAIAWFQAHSRAGIALVVGFFLGWVLG
jgi:uncharacterized membrane protein (Fun14 family)